MDVLELLLKLKFKIKLLSIVGYITFYIYSNIVFQTKAQSQKYLHEFTIVHFLVRLTGAGYVSLMHLVALILKLQTFVQIQHFDNFGSRNNSGPF